MQGPRCLPATCPPLPETCPPLPNMLAFDLPGVPGVGRRVPASGLYAVPGDLPAIAVYAGIVASLRARRWQAGRELRPARHCHGCVRFRDDGKQALAGGRGGRASSLACLGMPPPLNYLFSTPVPPLFNLVNNVPILIYLALSGNSHLRKGGFLSDTLRGLFWAGRPSFPTQSLVEKYSTPSRYIHS
jgi:hypothetical protein